MNEYRVVWEIDSQAKNEYAAAEQALEIQRDKESWALRFDVWSGDKVVEVDLETHAHDRGGRYTCKQCIARGESG